MATQEFKCPNCGAPLDYPGAGATMRCPYCETSVVVPAEMRPQAEPVEQQMYVPIQPTVITIGRPEVIAPKPRRGLGCLIGVIVLAAIVFTGAMIAIPLIATNKATKIISKAIEPALALRTSMPLATDIPAPTEVPLPTSTATPIPFASLVNTFGAQGIGPGQLNDARYIAVDGSGMVYVADYMDGRIQVFDSNGKFQHGWQVGDANTIIAGMSVTHEGILYLALDGDIYRYNGAKGTLLDKIKYANGQEFGDLTTLPNGGVLGVWYQGRWGLITSLEGHREDLAWFDSDGNTTQTLQSAISGQTGNLALDVILAVDGQGTVYALSSTDGSVFKFTSKGKFLDRFDFQGSDPSQEGTCIAVDGQGRVYVGGGWQVSIFSPDGSFIQSFETEASIEKMAFSEQGDLYVVSGDTVEQYKLGELP